MFQDLEEVTYALDAIESPVSLFEPAYTDGGDPLFVMDQIRDKKTQTEAAKEIHISQAQVIVMDYLSVFIEMLQAKNLAPNTIRDDQTYIKPYLKYLEDFDLSPENTFWDTVRSFLKWIQAERTLSDRTVNMIFSHLPFVPDRTQVALFLNSLDDPKAKHPFLQCRIRNVFCPREKTGKTETNHYSVTYGIHPTVSNACASFWFPEDPLLWYAGMSMSELLKAIWNFDISICPNCGCSSMKPAGRIYANSF